MKAYEGVDVQIHIFLTSTLVGDRWSASRFGRFPPRETAPGTHQIKGWVDPRARLDDMENSNSDPFVIQPIESRYTDCAIPAPYFIFIRFQSEPTAVVEDIYSYAYLRY
jgi:hypothetical protein